ncbi:MAG: hypothetical protein N2643_04050 [Endomicrobia bacterium]|nr:hypothetical protein [Endomicrobiia bacterium]
MKNNILILIIFISFTPMVFSEQVSFNDWQVVKGGSSSDRINVTNTTILNIRQNAWWLAAGTFVTVQKIFNNPIDKIRFNISGNYTGVEFRLYNDIGELIDNLKNASGEKVINLNGSTAGLTFHLYLPQDVNQDPNNGFNITISSLNIDWYTATGGNVRITVRDTPSVVYPGAVIELTADFENIGGTAITSATASIILPSGTSLDTTYQWNTQTQYVNRVGAMLKPKFLPDNPPRLFAFGSDDWNSDTDITLQHITPFYQLGYPMSAYILAGALYMDTYSTDNKSFFGNDLIEFFKKQNWEIGYHTYHHPHMGLCLHMNSRWIGETTRRYKRGSTWGIPNTEEEQKIELLLGKYWLEVASDRRIEGFRNPFLEFNIQEGAETATKTPLRSSIWKTIGKCGIKYVCTVNEGPSGWPPQEVAPTPIAQLDPRTAIPSWVPMCDEVTISGDVTASYTDFSHKVHNILVGTQRCNVGGSWMWGTIYDGSLSEVYNFATTMNFLKKYVERHYTVTQTEVPRPYISGQSGSNATQKNVPVTFGLHPYSSSDYVPSLWQQENKKSIDWVPEIINYINTNYPDAKCVTHKDIVDYYLGRGTVRWVIKMPTQPGSYTFTIQTNEGSSVSYNIEVKSFGEIYNTRQLRAVKINSPQEVFGLRQKGYTDVIFTIKDVDGIDRSGQELDQIIQVCQQENLGVLCLIEVFKDAQAETKKYNGVVVKGIAEPTDTTYRNKLKNMVQTASSKNIKGIIFNVEIPSELNYGPTLGYSDSMVNHFKKWWGPPPVGNNSQDPTVENDPNYFSIYSAAATSDWRSNDISWLYYDIKEIARYYFDYDELNNLPLDSNGVRVVNGLLCKSESGSDNIGCSAFDELMAWGEFRRYIVADFVNEIASSKGSKKAYVIVPSAKDAHKLQYNSTFIHSADPIEFADITRRPCILPDKWNHPKQDYIDGIFYYINSNDQNYIRKCIDLARRIDYWVSEGANEKRGISPLNEYNSGKNKLFGIYLETNNFADNSLVEASLSSNPYPDGIMFTKDIFSSNILVNIITPTYGEVFSSTSTIKIKAEIVAIGQNISTATYKIDNFQEVVLSYVGNNIYESGSIYLGGFSTGTHILRVYGYGESGEISSSLTEFVILGPNKNVTLNILAPSNNEIFSSTSIISIKAEVVPENLVVSSVTYKIDNKEEKILNFTSGYIYVDVVDLNTFTTGYHILTVKAYTDVLSVEKTVGFYVLSTANKFITLNIVKPANYQIFFSTNIMEIMVEVFKFNLEISSITYSLDNIFGTLNYVANNQYNDFVMLNSLSPSTYTLSITVYTDSISVSSSIFVVIRNFQNNNGQSSKVLVEVKESGVVLKDRSYVSSLKPNFEFKVVPATASIKVYIDKVEVTNWLISTKLGEYSLEISLDKGEHIVEIFDLSNTLISSYTIVAESRLKIKDLYIIPNPAVNKQKIDVVYTLTQKADEVKVVLLSLSGKVIYETDGLVYPSQNKIEIQFSKIDNLENIDLVILKIYAKNYSGFDTKTEKVFFIRK